MAPPLYHGYRPACGVEVDPTNPGAATTHQGTKYVFCSEGCKEHYRCIPTVLRDESGRFQHALDVHGADITTEKRDEILAVYHELDVFDEVRDGIERLRDGGHDCYVVSNGNPEMLVSMIDHADIGEFLADTISADEVRTFKPAAEIYCHPVAHTGTPITEIVHVTSGWFDVMGAKHAGMQADWLDRKSAPLEPFGRGPDLIIETFYELAETFGL